MLRRLLVNVVKLVGGIAAVVLILAPITKFLGSVAFIGAAFVLLLCFLVLGLLDEELS
jgi:hypothetical protein